MPATAKLLATIAKLPHGAVVLPGLDTDLDDDSWELIGAGEDDDAWPAFGHPQFAMQALLARIGIGRDEVVALAPPAPHGREVLLSEALRPAAATDRWQDRLHEVDAQLGRGFGAVAVIEAANAEEESLAIAVALARGGRAPDTSAALVTPDRALARRVLAALGRWNIAADNSGGDALADTAAGVFARLAAELALGGVAPVALLALLKHPLFRLGAAAGAHAPRGRGARARDPARPAAARRRGRARPCARHLPSRARQAARQRALGDPRQRSARPARRRRGRRRAERPGRRSSPRRSRRWSGWPPPRRSRSARWRRRIAR